MKNRKKMRKQKRSNKKGIALVASLGLISTMTVLAVGLMAGGLAEVQAAKRFEERMIAFHLAEGAIDKTMVDLRNNISSGLSETDANHQNLSNSKYHASVTQVTDPNVLPIVYKISAFGTVYIPGSNVEKATERAVTATVEVTPATSLYDHVFFANSTMALSLNSQIDSYNSTNGSYLAAFANANADIGTNSNSNNSIALSGIIRIRGDVVLGPNADVNTGIITSGKIVIEGTRKTAAANKILDPIILPTAVGSKLPALVIKGSNTVTLPGGTYVYSSLSIIEKGRLNLSGPAKIYVNGNAMIAGKGIGTAQNLPPNLEIHVKGTNKVTLDGVHKFYGAIYAPKSEVNIKGKGDLFGAILGERIANWREGNFHFDEALLKNANGGSDGTSELRSWSEL